MPERRRSLRSQHSASLRNLAAAWFLPTVFMSGRKRVRRSLPTASRWRTIRSLRLPGSGTDGRIQKGESVETCSIITTSPNSLLANIHDRMPVILERDSYDIWLDPGLKKVDDLRGLLQPYPSE